MPAFLIGLGATKAGTSWLYDHLAGHPECHFRTVKELHYFSMTEPEHFDRARVETEKAIAAVIARQAADQPNPKPYLARRLVDLSSWCDVLARRKIDVAAYRTYLTDMAGDARLVGEVTPAYALLPKDRLKHMTTVAARMKFVYLIRDPVARLWSHVRMIAARADDEAGFATAAVDGLTRILSGDLSGEAKGIVLRGDYARIIPRLKQAFRAETLWIQCQEDLLTVQGNHQLAGFLELTPTPQGLGRRVHQGRNLDLPEDLAVKARVFLQPQYDYVASILPNLPDAWRKTLAEGDVR